MERRDFLKNLGAAAFVTLAPGVAFAKSGRWGLLIDTTKCHTDCTACVTSCKMEMGLGGNGRPATDPQYLRKVEIKNPKSGKRISLPVMCQHCESPPCVDVCPTGASFKRKDGVVLVDRHICIGCRYCMMACPYKARSFAHEESVNPRAHNPRGKGTVEACTMCVHRLDAGRPPACVEGCHYHGKGAMVFGDIEDPNSDISKLLATYPSTALRPDLQLNPGVRYFGI